jgi:hypothetical protein
VRSRIAAILVATVVAVAAHAQTTEPAYVRYPRGIGFSVGQISGTGLSYRQWITPKVGLQASAGALYLPLKPGEGWISSAHLLDYWTGVEVFRSLYATEFTKWLFGQVYLFAGISHYGFIPWKEVMGTITPAEGVPYETVVGHEPGLYVPGIGLGGGVGIEMALFQHFSVAFELGYAAFWQKDAPDFVDQLQVNLVPQGVVQFRY